jgi:hypothetical protein
MRMGGISPPGRKREEDLGPDISHHQGTKTRKELVVVNPSCLFVLYKGPRSRTVEVFAHPQFEHHESPEAIAVGSGSREMLGL